MYKSRSGFTIVELLIVIVVIAILAAISIVAYSGISNRANDTSIKSDLRAISQKMHLTKVEHDNEIYPAGNNGAYSYETLDIRVNRSAYATSPEVEINLLMCRTTPGREFAVLATSKSGKKFYTVNGEGVREYTGTIPWSDDKPNSHCYVVLPGSIAGGSGYNFSAVGGWRTWAAE